MKSTVGVSKSSLALYAFALVAIALPCSAITPPALRLADNLGNSVTIDSTGAVTYTGTCSAATCKGTPTPGSGYIAWTGVVGVFSITNAVGETKPFLTAPSIDIGLGTVTTIGAGTLTASWTDTGFFATGPEVLSYLTTYSAGSGSTTYTAYIDPANQPFGEGVGTQIGTIPNVTTNTSTTSLTVNVNETAQPVSMTQVVAVTLASGSAYSNDFGVVSTVGSQTASSPMISLKKTASTTKCNPFQKVTYTYVVKNTGNVTLTNLTITDDNATPTYTGDDFTVGTIASLAPGASQTFTASVYPPVTEGANDSSGWSSWGSNGWGNWGYNYNSPHAGGTLICKSKPNGNVEFTYLVDQSTSDNAYGTGSTSGWGAQGDPFSNLLNSGAEFQILDGQGNTVLDFVADYVSANSSYPSGYGTSGVKGNGGMIYHGSSSNIASITTSITDNLNQTKPFYKCTTNSPTSNPNWESKCAYKIEINGNAWGSKGFGGVACPVVQHPSKSSSCGQHTVKPMSSTATNTATVVAYFGTTELSATAKATVTIDASQQGWSKCGWF